ncbi:MAG: isoprenoid biosynthesis glyoxalase ElbB, partial [Bacteroidales bacterium]
EIGEALMTLLAIDQLGANYVLFAPDKEQYHVVNHLTGQPTKEKRNVLVESARIARGKIQSLDKYDAADFDGIVIPGGFGAAKNLSTYALDGVDLRVDEQVSKAIQDTYALQKPIAAMCIAPIILAKLLHGIEITLGNDKEIAQELSAMGACPKNISSMEVVVDKAHSIYTTPCYMLPNVGLADIAIACHKLISSIL